MNKKLRIVENTINLLMYLLQLMILLQTSKITVNLLKYCEVYYEPVNVTLAADYILCTSLYVDSEKDMMESHD